MADFREEFESFAGAVEKSARSLMSDSGEDDSVLPNGCDADEFGDLGKTKEQRNAKYFEDKNDDDMEQALPKLRVLKNCWFMHNDAFNLENRNIGSEESVESARIDWVYYQFKTSAGALLLTEKSSHTTKERRKKGKVTLNVVDYGVRDANARMAFSLGQFEDAIVYLEQMIQRKDDEPNVWNLLGKCHFKLEHLQESVDCFKKAIESLPDLPEPYINLFEPLVRMGEVELALACLYRARDFIDQFMLVKPRFSEKNMQQQLEAIQQRLSEFEKSRKIEMSRDALLIHLSARMEESKQKEFLEKFMIKQLSSNTGEMKDSDEKEESEFNPMNL